VSTPEELDAQLKKFLDDMAARGAQAEQELLEALKDDDGS